MSAAGITGKASLISDSDRCGDQSGPIPAGPLGLKCRLERVGGLTRCALRPGKPGLAFRIPINRARSIATQTCWRSGSVSTR